MLISYLSSHVALVAVMGGIVSAVFHRGIEDLLFPLVNQNATWNLRETFVKCLVSGLILGPLLGVIYYAFALYGFPEKELTPIQIIALFTLFFGLFYPLLGIVLQLLISKLFPNLD
ncbi:MAG: hypothetical protein AAFQ80_24395 [Cyanobacteria bacterium J06621_8]